MFGPYGSGKPGDMISPVSPHSSRALQKPQLVFSAWSRFYESVLAVIYKKNPKGFTLNFLKIAFSAIMQIQNSCPRLSDEC
jgi:hypothetical protein